MVKDQQIQQPLPSTSQLGRFALDFEYDKTIQQVRREVRIRTSNDSK